ncbi:MAG: hypothetical protein COC09_05105 [Gammaproteobacteria bacterium]|nr:YbaK/EbsC family protein [Gammaproteobacteria bacterium]PCH63699.1 MAG: hypothetical protein COC09_05105 [Gammaproteobacteria bacterium]
MAIAITLRDYLDSAGVRYGVVGHPYSTTSMQTARVTHINSHQLAKAVVLQDSEHYVVAVLPADKRIQLGRLRRKYQRALGLATEEDVGRLFFDCAPGAAPALGSAYGCEVIYDDSLADNEDIYFEGGTHTDLVHLSGGDFMKLMSNATHGNFCRAA